ncbi:MAG: hypothetical protein IT436_05860 [Phycisphaerales bacterium]|nr:hypothetical protein [Phycisphaerales bacterium]
MNRVRGSGRAGGLVSWGAARSAIVAIGLTGSARAAEPAGEVVMPSPLSAGAMTGLGTLKVTLDAGAYGRLREASRAILTGYAADPQHTFDLDLERFEVFTPDARIVSVRDGREVELDRPDVTLFRGTVFGEPGSIVFLALSPGGCQGHIQAGGETYILSPGPFTGDGVMQTYRVGAMAPGLVSWSQPVCGGAIPIPGHPMKVVEASPRPAPPQRDMTCREAYFAIETDHEFTASLFGGSTMAASAYSAILLGAVSEIQQREFNTRLRITYLRLWEDPADPWTAGGTGAQLDEFRAYWNAQMTHIQRTAVHYLSGRPLGGGVAYVGALCYPEYDYGLSANLSGYFPLPLQDHHGQNWDPFVTAHEIGHNFGTFHTHDGYTPPIDGCGLGDCSAAWCGTIMSYCHGCAGGMSNICLTYGPRVIERIVTFLDYESVCNLVLGPPSITGQPARAAACPGATVAFGAAASGGASLAYQWRRDGAPVAGATGVSLEVAASAATAGVYDVVVSNACASSVSAPARLVLRSADLNGDLVTDFTDYLDFLNRFDAEDETVDFNGDGLVDFADYLEFLNLYSGICG